MSTDPVPTPNRRRDTGTTSRPRAVERHAALRTRVNGRPCPTTPWQWRGRAQHKRVSENGPTFGAAYPAQRVRPDSACCEPQKKPSGQHKLIVRRQLSVSRHAPSHRAYYVVQQQPPSSKDGESAKDDQPVSLLKAISDCFPHRLKAYSHSNSPAMVWAPTQVSGRGSTNRVDGARRHGLREVGAAFRARAHRLAFCILTCHEHEAVTARALHAFNWPQENRNSHHADPDAQVGAIVLGRPSENFDNHSCDTCCDDSPFDLADRPRLLLQVLTDRHGVGCYSAPPVSARTLAFRVGVAHGW
jgi:hypothetical protein